MKLNRTEFMSLLSELDCQVFYNHTTTKDVVNLPFIVVLDTGSSNFIADDTVYEDIINYNIIVHTTDRDDEICEDLQDLLKENSIPYELNDVDWDEDNLFYALTYEVSL